MSSIGGRRFVVFGGFWGKKGVKLVNLGDYFWVI